MRGVRGVGGVSDLRGVSGLAYLNMQSRIKMCICVLKYAEFPECIKKYSIAYFIMQKTCEGT